MLKLLVDKASGATTMLRNEFVGGKFIFTNIGVVTGGATCTEGYGWDLRGMLSLAIHCFASKKF